MILIPHLPSGEPTGLPSFPRHYAAPKVDYAEGVAKVERFLTTHWNAEANQDLDLRALGSKARLQVSVSRRTRGGWTDFNLRPVVTPVLRIQAKDVPPPGAIFLMRPARPSRALAEAIVGLFPGARTETFRIDVFLYSARRGKR